MKTRYTILIALLSLFLSACQSSTGETETAASENTPAADTITAEPAATAYDSVLAGKLGADEYGMSQYVMAFLKAGPKRDQPKEERARLQRAHLDNINRLAEEGKLVLAGPFLDKGDLRGIYIFNVATVEEAEALTSTDPAIQAGSLIMELHPWYGSAALKELNERHKKVAKKGI